MKRVFLFLALLACACTCLPHSPEDAFKNSPFVFLGILAKLDVTKNEKIADFTVIYSWKGVTKGIVKVASPFFDECSPELQYKVGEIFLIYASPSASDELPPKYNLSTCSRSANKNRASEDLKFLESIPKVYTANERVGN